jgi:hypothetical protein
MPAFLNLIFFRRCAFALSFSGSLLTGQSLPAFSQAKQGENITNEQCRAISATAVAIVTHHADRAALSPEFKQSFRNFLGANLTCDGPRQLVWRTREDWATFQTISSQLLAPGVNISLERAGVKLAPSPIAPEAAPK